MRRDGGVPRARARGWLAFPATLAPRDWTLVAGGVGWLARREKGGAGYDSQDRARTVVR